MISAIGPADLAADPLLLAAYATYGKNCQASHDKYIETLDARKATLQEKNQALAEAKAKEDAIMQKIATGDKSVAGQLVPAIATVQGLQTDVATLEQEICVIGVNIRVTHDVATHNAATVAIAEDIMKQAKTLVPVTSDAALTQGGAALSLTTDAPGAAATEAALPTVTVGASLGAAVSPPGTASPTPPSDDPGTGGEGEGSLLGKRGREEEGMEEVQGEQKKSRPEMSRPERSHEELYEILSRVRGGVVAYTGATDAISNAKGEGWSHKSLSATIVELYPEMEKHVYP